MFKRATVAFLLYPVHFFVLINPAYSNNLERVALANAQIHLLSKAQLIKPVSSNKAIDLLVFLKPRNQKQMEQLAQDIYNPNSLRYQQFLTKDELEKDYEQPESAKRRVEEYFISQGMDTKVRGNFIVLKATTAQIKDALNTQINWYVYKKRKFFANASAPMVPVTLKPYIQEIIGLDNISTTRPLFKKSTVSMRFDPVHPLDFIWDSFLPKAQPTTTSVNNKFSGAQLRKAYQFDNLSKINNQTIDGSGQTVIITASCGNSTPQSIMNDANKFSTQNGLSQLTSSNFLVLNEQLQPYSSSNCLNTDQATKDLWDNEIAIDVQSTHTAAPNAKIVLVLSNQYARVNTSVSIINLYYELLWNNFTLKNFPNASVVSNAWSWGDEALYPSYNYLNYVLGLASASGLSFNFSTGDCGDESYASSNTGCDGTGTKRVNFPATSPFVTAVGGTSLFVDNSWNYAFETVWGTYYLNQFDSGGGGGLSSKFTLPAWQSSIATFTAGGYGTVGSKRAIPDISMLGDPNTGLKIISAGAVKTVGSTSVSTSLFSGVLALVNQARILNGIKTPIGQAAPYLYTSNSLLVAKNALNLIAAPHSVISGASSAPKGLPAPYNTPPDSAFTLTTADSKTITFAWNSSLTIPPNQFWNDAVGVGSPNIPQFVAEMSKLKP